MKLDESCEGNLEITRNEMEISIFLEHLPETSSLFSEHLGILPTAMQAQYLQFAFNCHEILKRGLRKRGMEKERGKTESREGKNLEEFQNIRKLDAQVLDLSSAESDRTCNCVRRVKRMC